MRVDYDHLEYELSSCGGLLDDVVIVCTLGWVKKNLWGLGVGSYYIVVRFPLLKGFSHLCIGGPFWQKGSLLEYTMTLLQGPKDPVLPTLIQFCSQHT